MRAHIPYARAGCPRKRGRTPARRPCRDDDAISELGEAPRGPLIGSQRAPAQWFRENDNS